MSALLSAPGVKLVVKHTFLEYVEAGKSPVLSPRRPRRFTDSGALWSTTQLEDGPKKAQGGVQEGASNHSTSLPESPHMSDAENESVCSADVEPTDRCRKKTQAEKKLSPACSPAWVPLAGLEDACSPAWSPWHAHMPITGTDDQAAAFEPLPPAVMWQDNFEHCEYWWPPMQEGELFDATNACNFGFVYEDQLAQGWVAPDHFVPFDGMLYDGEMPCDAQEWLEMENCTAQGLANESATPKTARNTLRWADQQDEPDNNNNEDSTECSSSFGKTSSSADSNSDSSNTTVMIRNLPNGFTRSMLLELIDSEGFAARYDFAYLPVDFSSGLSLGYGFINLISPVDANEFSKHFSGFSRWPAPSDAVCTVTWGEPYQGLSQHVERYRNSPVMHSSVPDEWKPILIVNGLRVEFPAPTKRIKAPKVRNRLDAALKAGNSA